jgi:WD40 repeat protein
MDTSPQYYLQKQQCVTVFTGHEKGVRALAVISAVQFASASADGHIMLWTTRVGDTFCTIHGQYFRVRRKVCWK